MKLSSPRTWLLIAAAAVLLVGVGIVYVVKTRPDRSGWTTHEQGDFSITAPIREGGMSYGGLHHRTTGFTLTSGGRLTVHYSHALMRRDTEPLEAELDYHFQREYHGRPHILVLNCKRITSNGNPAYVLTTVEGVCPRKRLVVVTHDRLYEVCTDIVPGVFSEDDADCVFRSFRPR